MSLSFISIARGSANALYSVCMVDRHDSERAGVTGRSRGDFFVSCCSGTTQFGFRTPSKITRKAMEELLDLS